MPTHISRPLPILRVLRQSSRSFARPPHPGQMRALLAHQYGGIEELRLSNSARVPGVAAPSDVTVRVCAASVNPVDLAMLGGYGAGAFAPLRRLAAFRGESRPELPLILGRDFSGEVLSVGKAAGHGLRPGQAVFGAVWPFCSGTLCDVVNVRANDIAPKPECWSHLEAASVPYAGLTAFSALTQAGLYSPRTFRGASVLVHGASGGVGSLAIQLAASWGAFVVGTVRQGAEDFSLQLGANAIVGLNPDSDLITEVTSLSPDGTGYDVVLDCVGLELISKVVKSGSLGRYVTLRFDLLRQMDQIGPLGAATAALTLLQRNVESLARSQRFMSWGFFRPSGANLRQMAALAEKGQLRPFVDSVFPLEDAPEAFRKLQAGGVRGKVVVNLNR